MCSFDTRWPTSTNGSKFLIPTRLHSRNSGLRVEKVLRNLDDPTEVVPWFEVTDLEKARAFVNSPEVPDARQQSGVVDEPDISIVNRCRPAYLPAERIGPSPGRRAVR